MNATLSPLLHPSLGVDEQVHNFLGGRAAKEKRKS